MPSTCHRPPGSAKLQPPTPNRASMPDERIEILRKVSLFEDLSDKELKAVANATKERRYDTGDVIVSEGDSGVGFFVIGDGTARVEAKGSRVATLAPGGVLRRGRPARRPGRPPHRIGDRRVAADRVRAHLVAVHAASQRAPRACGEDRQEPCPNAPRDAGARSSRRVVSAPASMARDRAKRGASGTL